MSEKIFRNYAQRYWESGMPVIPLRGKVPVISNWQIWSERLQTEDELEWLIDRFPDCNIGTVMGLWGIALDIDTDDARIMKLVPYSPYRRKGAEGFISIFKIDAALQSQRPHKFPIELLTKGTQIVLPPSIHPDTKLPYLWIGEEDIVTRSDLPVITQSDFAKIIAFCERNSILRKSKTRTETIDQVSACLADPGRNNRLSRIAYAIACDDTSTSEAIDRLLELDTKEHGDHPDGPWFSDKKEPHRGINPVKAATRMYERAVASSKKRGHRNGELTLTIARESPSKVTVTPSVPRPRGLMKTFQDYCNTISVGNQDALGLGGAITLMAAVCSNRFRTVAGSYDVWPNLFTINLAHSGFGKETPQRAIDELLADTELLGSATYKSGSSIVMNLPKQPERLDLIDECAMLLRAMCSQEDYKSEIVDVLSSLYSKSNSRFLGFASRADGPRFGACWNPCVNILGSTTPQGFRGSVSKDMAAKGLMPRFLVFWQKEIGDFKRIIDHDRARDLSSELQRRIRLLLTIDKPEHPSSRQMNLLDPGSETQVRYNPELIPMTAGAQADFLNIMENYYNAGKTDPESFESAFQNRFAQHTAKLALLDAISLGHAEIDSTSIEWAHSVVRWQWETVKELYELASAENDHEKDVLKVLNFIKSKHVVTQSQISRAFRGIWDQKLEGILKQLEKAGNIERGKDTDSAKRGPRAILYRFVEK